MAEVRSAIRAAPAFIFVISEASASSEICRIESEYASSVHKRMIPVALEDVDPTRLPPGIANLNWIFARDDSDLQRALDKVKQALDTDPEWAAAHSRMLVRAQEWEDGNRDSSLLLRGSDLTQAERWLTQADDRSDPQTTTLQLEYIIGSRRQATRSQRLRMAVLGAGLLVSAVLAVFALIQRNRADERAHLARSRELAATAVAQRSTNPELALLLAVEAANQRQTAEAQRAVRETLVESYGRGVLQGHTDAVNGIAISSNGRLAASASSDGTVRIWDLRANRSLQVLDPHAGEMTDVAFNPRTGDVFAVTATGRVISWDPTTGHQSLMVQGGEGGLSGVAVSPRGHLIAIAGDDGAAVLTTAGRPQQTLRPASQAFDVDFSPDGRRVVAAGANGTARVFRTVDGSSMTNLSLGRRSGPFLHPDVNAAQFSPNGRLIVTASDDGFARLWGSHDGRLRQALPASHDYVTSADFSPNGQRVVTGSYDGRAEIWNLAAIRKSDGPNAVSRAGPETTINSPSGQVLSSAFADDHHVVTAHSDGLARIWDIGKADVAFSLRHQAPVQSATFSVDGARILSAVSRRVEIWDVSRQHLVHKSLDYPGALWSLTASPSGRDVAAVGQGGSIRIWNATGHLTDVLRADRKILFGVAFSPNGREVVAGGSGGALIWRRGSHPTSLRLAPTPEGVGAVAFSPTGDLVATAGFDGTVRLWDAVSGEPVRQLTGHSDAVDSVAFSPDGKLLASSGEDRTARIWDVASGDTRAVLRGHAGSVFSVTFSPDGTQVATGGTDRTLRVWDSQSGQLLDTLEGATYWVNSVAYSPDGKRILVAGADRHTYVMRCGVCRPFSWLLDLARARVRAALTPQERDQYLREAGVKDPALANGN